MIAKIVIATHPILANDLPFCTACYKLNHPFYSMTHVMIILEDEKKRCGVCNKNTAIILCDGCQIALCVDCRVFDLWGYGCGHVDTKVFCPPCFADGKINPYSGEVN